MVLKPRKIAGSGPKLLEYQKDLMITLKYSYYCVGWISESYYKPWMNMYNYKLELRSIDCRYAQRDKFMRIDKVYMTWDQKRSYEGEWLIIAVIRFTMGENAQKQPKVFRDLGK